MRDVARALVNEVTETNVIRQRPYHERDHDEGHYHCRALVFGTDEDMQEVLDEKAHAQGPDDQSLGNEAEDELERRLGIGLLVDLVLLAVPGALERRVGQIPESEPEPVRQSVQADSGKAPGAAQKEAVAEHYVERGDTGKYQRQAEREQPLADRAIKLPTHLAQ